MARSLLYEGVGLALCLHGACTPTSFGWDVSILLQDVWTSTDLRPFQQSGRITCLPEGDLFEGGLRTSMLNAMLSSEPPHMFLSGTLTPCGLDQLAHVIARVPPGSALPSLVHVAEGLFYRRDRVIPCISGTWASLLQLDGGNPLFPPGELPPPLELTAPPRLYLSSVPSDVFQWAELLACILLATQDREESGRNPPQPSLSLADLPPLDPLDLELIGGGHLNELLLAPEE